MRRGCCRTTATQVRLTVFNVSESPVAVSPAIIIEGHTNQVGSISLGPHETKSLNLRELIATAAAGETPSAGAVLLKYSGAAHAVQPMLIIDNPATGLLLTPEFGAKRNDQNERKTTLVFPNVMLGEEAPPASQMSAYLLLSNSGDSPAAPKVTAYYLNSKGAGLGKAVLPVQSLSAAATRLVNLSNLAASGAIPSGATRVALVVQHDGYPGRLGVVAFSSDPTNNSTHQSWGAVLPNNVTDISYWDNANVLGDPYVKNESTEDAGALATLLYETPFGTGEYSLPALVVPGQKAQQLGVTKTAVSAVPDENGAVIPSGVSSGVVTLAPVPVPGASGTNDSVKCPSQCGDNLWPRSSPQEVTAVGQIGASENLEPRVVFAPPPDDCATPYIDSITPDYGSLGETNGYPVTITGTGLSLADNATFSPPANVACLINSATDTVANMTCYIPWTEIIAQEYQFSLENLDTLRSSNQKP